MTQIVRRAFPVLCVLCSVATPGLLAAQTLETETARPLGKGVWTAAGGYEHQVSSDGTEIAVPLAFEYGFTRALDIMAEPVFFTAIDPADSHPGPHATGLGDLEITASYLIRDETSGFPALALAGEAKLPTAKNTTIGTGQPDETVYLIASKRFGKLDTHFNASYAFIGQPPDVRLNNTYGFAVAGFYQTSGLMSYFGEILGNTASSSESDAATPTTPPNAVAVEAPGAELVGTLGMGATVRNGLFASISLSVDNNAAVMVRPGFVFSFE